MGVDGVLCLSLVIVLMRAKRAVRQSVQWNSDVYANCAYTDMSGNSYSFAHLNRIVDHPLKFEFKDRDGKKKKGCVLVDIIFDHHCYTKEKCDGDTDVTLVTEFFNDGSTKNRVFDLERYNYSKTLVAVIKGISHKTCRASRTPGKAIRLEAQERQRPNVGIYILMKMKLNSGGNKLKLFVETCHRRSNEPYDLQLQDPPERHMLILGRWLRDLWPFLVQ